MDPALPGSLHRVPIEKDAPFTEPSFKYLSEFLVSGPPMILNRAPVEKGAHLPSLLKTMVNEHSAKFPSVTPTVSDFCSRALLQILPYPQKRSPTVSSLNRALTERDAPLPEHPYYLLKFPVIGTP